MTQRFTIPLPRPEDIGYTTEQVDSVVREVRKRIGDKEGFPEVDRWTLAMKIAFWNKVHAVLSRGQAQTLGDIWEGETEVDGIPLTLMNDGVRLVVHWEPKKP